MTGTVGAYFGGKLDDRVGSRAVIVIALVLLIIAAVTIISIDREHILFILPASAATAGDGLFASLPEKVYVGLAVSSA